MRAVAGTRGGMVVAAILSISAAAVPQHRQSRGAQLIRLAALRTSCHPLKLDAQPRFHPYGIYTGHLESKE